MSDALIPAPRTAFAAAAAAFVELVAAVPSSAWDRPGLGRWTVRDLVGHTSRALSTIESYVGQEAESARLDSPLAYFNAVRSTLADPEAVERRGREAGASLGDHPAARVAALADRVAALVASTSDDAPVGTPVGEMALGDYLPTRTFELTVHTLDLARALNLAVPGALSPAVAECCRLTGELAAASPHAADLLLLVTGRTGLPSGLSAL